MNLPSIPDNLYKLFFVCGLAIIIYFYFNKLEPLQNNFEISTKKFNSDILNTSISIDSLLTIAKKLSDSSNNIVGKQSLSDLISDYKNPKSNKKRVNYDPIKLDLIFEQLIQIFKRRININATTSNFVEHRINLYKNYNREQSLYSDKELTYKTFILVGIAILLLGLVGIISHQIIQDELLKRQLNEKDIYYKHCQSCGKKFNSIIKCSTNSNGVKNRAFCCNCHENEEFIEPDLTFEELKKRTSANKIFRYNIFYKWIIIQRLKKLDRWNANQYD